MLRSLANAIVSFQTGQSAESNRRQHRRDEGPGQPTRRRELADRDHGDRRLQIPDGLPSKRRRLAPGHRITRRTKVHQMQVQGEITAGDDVRAFETDAKPEILLASFQDGNINCEKKRCPRSVCQNQKNNSKKQPLEDECCQCRARRPQNGQRRRQKQQEKSQNNLTKS